MKHKIIVVAAIALAIGLPCAAADKACTLVTPAELESLLGKKVPMNGSAIGNAVIGPSFIDSALGTNLFMVGIAFFAIAFVLIGALAYMYGH